MTVALDGIVVVVLPHQLLVLRVKEGAFVYLVLSVLKDLQLLFHAQMVATVTNPVLVNLVDFVHQVISV